MANVNANINEILSNIAKKELVKIIKGKELQGSLFYLLLKDEATNSEENITIYSQNINIDYVHNVLTLSVRFKINDNEIKDKEYMMRVKSDSNGS